MLDWINTLMNFFADCLSFLLRMPVYGAVSAGTVLIAIAVIGIIIDFVIRRVR